MATAATCFGRFGQRAVGVAAGYQARLEAEGEEMMAHSTDPTGIVTSDRSLAQLAAAINAEHQAVAAVVRSGVEHARAAGELLLQAKKQCGHGAWLPWLKEHCPMIGMRQVQRYMRVASKWSELVAANASGTSHLTIDGAIAMLTSPTDRVPDGVSDRLEEVVASLAEVTDDLNRRRDLSVETLREVARMAQECQLLAHAVMIDAATGLGETLSDRGC